MLGYFSIRFIWVTSWRCGQQWYDERTQSLKTRLSLPILGAQLSKLERQWALPPNSGRIMKKQLFTFPNSLTIHQTSTLHDTFYFNYTWTKIQLWSEPVNMQPDKTKCYSQVSKTHYNVMACCFQDAEYILWKPPFPTDWDIIITHGEELQDFFWVGKDEQLFFHDSTVHLSQLSNNSPNLNFAQHFLFQ